MAYYVVYFAGDALNAFSDWFPAGDRSSPAFLM